MMDPLAPMKCHPFFAPPSSIRHLARANKSKARETEIHRTAKE